MPAGFSRIRLEQQVYNIVKIIKKLKTNNLKSTNDIEIAQKWSKKGPIFAWVKEHVNPGWCWKMDNGPVDGTSKSVTAPFKTSV